MRKILSLMLIVVMISFSFAIPVYAADNNAVTVLNALEILIGDELGNLNLDKPITRAEYATILLRVLNVNSGHSTEEIFLDVPTTHWAYSAINDAYNLKIINGCGDGTFRPDNNVSYEEAVKMIMCVLGYEPFASSKGGYPTGYLVAANQAKVTSGVSSKMTREDVAQLIFNALSTPMMEQTSYGNDVEYSILNGKNNNDYVTLLTKKDIYIASGVVGSKDIANGTIEIDVKEVSDDLEFKVGKLIVNIGSSNIEEFENNYVNVYISETRRNEYTAVVAIPSNFGNSLVINAEDIKSIQNNKVEYFIKGTNTKTIKLDENFTCSLNKNDCDIEDLLADDIELTFVENTGDNAYDMIIGSLYISARVDAVYPEKDRISIDGYSLTFDFDDEDIEVIFTDLNGNNLDLYDFAEDDVVAVLSDTKTLRKYNEYIKIVKLTDSYVIGEVDEKFDKNGKDYVVINGKEYADGTSKELSVGDMGTFYIGLTNTIIDFDGSVAASDYAYILDAEKSDEAFSSDIWQIKLLTKDGVGVYTLTSNASDKFDGATDKIVTYRTNAQGKISKIEEVKGTIKSFAGKYNERTQMIDGVVVEDYSAIFNISATDNDKAFYADINYLTDESYYEGYGLKVDGEYEALVVTKGKSQYANENGFAIVTKIASTKDNSDDEVYKVSIVENEENKTLYFNDESETDYNTIVDKNLPIGSVIMYNAKDDTVLNYIVIGTIENGKFDFAIDDTAIAAEFDEDVEFVLGYITNDKRKKVSAGESITIDENLTVVVTADTNQYTYDNSGRNINIEVGTFLAGDAYYKEENSVTPVFVKIVDGDLIDIYTFNDRATLE